MTGTGSRRVVPLLLAALLVTLPRAGDAQQRPTPDDRVTLAELVGRALQSHPSLRGAEARVQAGAAALGRERAVGLPRVMVRTGATRFELPMVVAPLHAFDPQNPPGFDRTLLQSSLSAEHTLVDGGLRGARSRAAEARIAEAQVEREASAADVTLAVLEAYVSAATGRSLALAGQRRLQALESEVLRARRLVQEGAAPEVELLRAVAALGSAEADLASATAGVEAAHRTLALLTGVATERIAVSALSPLGPPAAGGTPLPAADAPDAGHTGYSVSLAARRVDRARAERRSASAAFIPRVEVGVGIQHFGSAAGDHTAEWQASMGVSYPLFQGGARFRAVDQAEAELSAARASLDAARLGEALERARLLARIDAEAARVNALDRVVAQFEEVARVEALALAEGAGVQRDFLAAEAELFEARARLAEARGALVSTRARLERLQGTLDVHWIDQLEGGG